jgi:hypothetical protein
MILILKWRYWIKRQRIVNIWDYYLSEFESNLDNLDHIHGGIYKLLNNDFYLLNNVNYKM